MEVKTINVRDLQRNMKAVTAAVARGRRFIVLKNAKPIFEIQPTASGVKRPKKTQAEFIAALNKMIFTLPKKENLSEKIDEIVYQ